MSSTGSIVRSGGLYHPAFLTMFALISVANDLRAEPVLPEMVPVPAGTFQMGQARNMKAAAPVVQVTFPEGFHISATEITWNEYAPCVRAGGCTASAGDHGWGRDTRPVVNVSAAQAGAYAAWLSRVTGDPYRLPSEAEWEYAARAGSDTLFPWGNKMTPGKANCRKCDGPEVYHASRPVRTYPANAWGLYDTSGNVWEWTADCWTPNHQGRSSSPAPRTDGNCYYNTIRGGSWYYLPRMSWSAARSRHSAHLPSYNIGFRVVRDRRPDKPPSGS